MLKIYLIIFTEKIIISVSNRNFWRHQIFGTMCHQNFENFGNNKWLFKRFWHSAIVSFITSFDWPKKYQIRCYKMKNYNFLKIHCRESFRCITAACQLVLAHLTLICNGTKFGFDSNNFFVNFSSTEFFQNANHYFSCKCNQTNFLCTMFGSASNPKLLTSSRAIPSIWGWYNYFYFLLYSIFYVRRKY